MNEHLQTKNFLNERETSKFLTISVRTLQHWREKGGGPVFFKFGAHRRSLVRYQLTDIIQWAEGFKRS